MMTKINSIHIPAGLDSVSMFCDFGPFAFCLPSSVQYLELS